MPLCYSDESIYFCSLSMHTDHGDSTKDGSARRPNDEYTPEDPPVPQEIAINSNSLQQNQGPDTPKASNAPSPSNIDSSEIWKGKSLAHYHIMQEQAVFVSFDIETGGENCGIVQISAQ